MNERRWYEHRRFDPKDRKEWQAVVALDHPEVNSVYPPGFWIDYAPFCAGDLSKLNMAVSFLESDPWVFGSGCVKEDFIHAIRDMDLRPAYIKRLQTVVLSVVDRRDGREFRDYCRLARKVDSPELREQLKYRLTRSSPVGEDLTPDQPSLLQAITRDKDIRRRARWVLEALERKEGMRPPGPQ